MYTEGTASAEPRLSSVDRSRSEAVPGWAKSSDVVGVGDAKVLGVSFENKSKPVNIASFQQ